ncbi:MAG: response regulator transcription factor [Spirochaetaceae bacterium]|nr:MAG: response regulator transcription factor [Spirochaetaceae bacterium]
MKQIRVLIVDDQESVRQSLRTILQLVDDIEVVGEARDGSEAVEQTKRLAPDVVLMDMKMAPSDGLSAAKSIREHSESVGVVMITMHHSDIARGRAVEAGVDVFVEKGIAMEDLVDKIRHVYRKRRKKTIF